MSALPAAALAFGVVLLVELPDKPLVASLVLSTRYRSAPGAPDRGRIVRGVRDRGRRSRQRLDNLSTLNAE